MKKDEYIDAAGYDPGNPQPFSASCFRMGKPDDSEEDVEYSSIPRVDDMEGFQRALTMADMIRLEPDILDWLVSGGLDYETRANAILRRQMLLDKGLVPPAIHS